MDHYRLCSSFCIFFHLILGRQYYDDENEDDDERRMEGRGQGKKDF
jgi:hypothetical protein